MEGKWSDELAPRKGERMVFPDSWCQSPVCFSLLEHAPKSLGQSSWTDRITFSIFPLPSAGLFTEFQADFQKRTVAFYFLKQNASSLPK